MTTDPAGVNGQQGPQAQGQQGQQSTPASPQGGDDRSGKDFTRKGKAEVIDQNKQANGGQTVCAGCGVNTTPAQQSKAGVPTPANETRVDHINPKSNKGAGSPPNGQVLCSACNLKKGAKVPGQN